MSETQAGGDGLVVVGVDGSDASLEALEWAAHYAAALGKRVRALDAWHYPTDYGFAVPIPELDFAADARALVDEALEAARGRYPSVVFESEIVNAPPALALIDESEHAELLVVGSRGHGGFSGMLLGSVSAHCVHHAHCPVVVVR